MIERRMRGRLNPQSLVVTAGARPVPWMLSGRMLGIEAGIPARTARTYFIYFSDDPQIGPPPDAPRLAGSEHNLVRSGGFERGDRMPEGWTTSGKVPGVTFGLDQPRAPGEGGRAARIWRRKRCQEPFWETTSRPRKNGS